MVPSNKGGKIDRARVALASSVRVRTSVLHVKLDIIYGQFEIMKTDRIGPGAQGGQAAPGGRGEAGAEAQGRVYIHTYTHIDTYIYNIEREMYVCMYVM